MTIEILLAILGIIIGAVVSIVLFRISRKHTLLDKKNDTDELLPKAMLSFFDFEIPKDSDIDLVYCVDLEKYNSKNVILYYELPISIGNIGNITLKNIHLTYEFGTDSPLPIEDRWVKKNNTLPYDNGSRKFTKQHKRVVISESIKSINPKIRFDTGEIIKLKETKMELKNRPIKGGTYDIKVNFSHIIKLIFDAENIGGESFSFNIELINYKTEKDFTNHLNEKYKKLKPIEKYEYCLNRKIFVIHPEIQKIDSKNGIALNCGKVFSDNIKFVDLSKTIKKV